MASLPANALPFTVFSPIASKASIAAAVPSCTFVDVLDSARPAGERFQYCDGTQPRYELDLAASGRAGILDLVGSAAIPLSANAAGALAIARTSGQLTVSRQTLIIDAVTDSAAYSAGLSAGGLTLFSGRVSRLERTRW